MNKIRIFKTLVSGLAISTLPVATLFSVSSCGGNGQQEEKEQITLEVPESTTVYQIEIPVTFLEQPQSVLTVTPASPWPEELEIEQEGKFPVVEKAAKILINIKDSVKTTKLFDYALKLSYTDSSGAEQTYTSKKLNTIYIYSPPSNKDELLPLATIVQRNNNHDFDFRIRYVSKNGSLISNVDPEFSLVMSDCGDELSFLGSSSAHSITCPLSYDERGRYYYIGFIVHLNQSITTTDNYDFDLNISFTNSFGETQTNDINDFVVSFICNRDSVVPEEYFQFEKDPNHEGQAILTGLTVETPKEEYGQYLTIKIPETAEIPDGHGGTEIADVTSIGTSAFGKIVTVDDHDYEWFSNIHKVIFNSHINYVAEDAFQGCINLYTVDVSAYTPASTEWDDVMPKWVPAEGEDAKEFFKYSAYKTWYWVGYETNDPKWDDEKYIASVKWELKEIFPDAPATEKDRYFVCKNSQICSENFFELDSTGTKILGKRPGITVDDLKKCKILEIPDYITSLADFSLTEFGYTPYYNSTSEEYETRRLIFSRNIEQVGIQHNVGLGGPIVFNMSKLEQIPNNAFQDVNSYAWSVKESIVSEAPYLLFVNCQKLTTIGNGAFVDVPLNQEAYGAEDCEYQLPEHLTTIGDYAFRGHQYKEIDIPGSVTSIGTKAFSQTDSEKGKPGKLFIIDLHELTYEGICEAFKENGHVFDFSLYFDDESTSPDGYIEVSYDTTDEEIKQLRALMKTNGTEYTPHGMNIVRVRDIPPNSL